LQLAAQVSVCVLHFSAAFATMQDVRETTIRFANASLASPLSERPGSEGIGEFSQKNFPDLLPTCNAAGLVVVASGGCAKADGQKSGTGQEPAVKKPKREKTIESEKSFDDTMAICPSCSAGSQPYPSPSVGREPHCQCASSSCFSWGCVAR